MNAFARQSLLKKHGIYVSRPGMSNQVTIKHQSGQYHFTNPMDADRFISNLLVQIESMNPDAFMSEIII